MSVCNYKQYLKKKKLFLISVLEEKSKLLRNIDDFDVENAIQNIESLALISEQIATVSDIVPKTDADNFYDYMIQAVDKLQTSFRYSDNIYKFMKANGAVRILSNNLINNNLNLRTKLLLLIKEIFDIAPTTADALLPLNLVDRLIDIFENDRNLALKAHALDVLYKWLPNNPQAQVRVMKISGLETFYKQIDKLEIGVVKNLMDLFNIILKEHLHVRNDKEQNINTDKLKIYQSIGMLERIATPKVCNGLFNIFDMLWSYNRNENDNVKIILELMVNVKPFCLKYFMKKAKTADLFEALLKYVEDKERKEYFEQVDVNVEEVAAVIREYLKKEKRVGDAKDEF